MPRPWHEVRASALQDTYSHAESLTRHVLRSRHCDAMVYVPGFAGRGAPESDLSHSRHYRYTA